MNRLFPFEREATDPPSVTGEVIYESVHHSVHRKAVKVLVKGQVSLSLRELPDPVEWASFLVIFSPGQDYEEVRCQVDIETDVGFAGFAIGFGSRPELALNEAMERLQWHEKKRPLPMTV
ncbi:MAG TPA: hypothetical protein VIH99_12945 [Bdellovibrionota bacterium]|jgi:hypothetical protein